VHRLTDGQAHLRIFGGHMGVVERCWFQHAPYGVVISGGAMIRLYQNYFSGSWDTRVVEMQETFASVRIMNDPVFGFATLIQLHDNYFSGYQSPGGRTITDGAISYVSHEDAGPAQAIYVDGVEGLEIKGGYIGVNNSYGIYVVPGTSDPSYRLTQNIDIQDVFFDGARLYSLYFGSVDGSGAAIVNISNNRFNGQRVTRGVLHVDAPSGVQCIKGLTFNNNISQGHNRAPLYLAGAAGARITNNVMASYNDRGGGTTPEFAAGAFVGLYSREVHFANNLWGGGLNTWQGPNNCKWGVYFDGNYGSASNERGILGMTGGSVVGGIPQTYPEP
jgi:hypothetical protein